MTKKDPLCCKWPPAIEVKLIQEENEPPPTLPALLSKALVPILSIGGAIGVLILSLGWSYAWHWFAQWDVPFASLELGPDLLIEYGRLVVLHFWWLALLWIAAVFGGAIAIHRAKAKPIWLALLIVIAIIIPWLFSHQLGASRAAAAASDQQLKNFAGWPEVHVIFKTERAEALPDSLLAEISEGPNLCHRLLFRASDGLWLVKIESTGLPGAAVFLPNEAITYLRLSDPQGGDC